MARPRKTYQTPIIEEETVVEKPVDSVNKPKKQSDPVLIPNDGNAITRRAPTMDSRYVANNLRTGYAYGIDKVVHSVIYGDFYLLKNGLYVTKVGNYTIRE